MGLSPFAFSISLIMYLLIVISASINADVKDRYN